LTGAEHGKLRVLLVEASDGRINDALTVVRFQIAVALSATGIRNVSKAHSSSVLDVAGTARGRERLARIVWWSIVASQARLVRHRRAVTRRSQVAHIAITSEHGVSRRERTFGVDILFVKKSSVSEPAGGKNRQANREPQDPPAKAAGSSEILQVDPLRE